MRAHVPSEAVYWTALVLLALALFGHFVPSSAFLAQYHSLDRGRVFDGRVARLRDLAT